MHDETDEGGCLKEDPRVNKLGREYTQVKEPMPEFTAGELEIRKYEQMDAQDLINLIRGVNDQLGELSKLSEYATQGLSRKLGYSKRGGLAHGGLNRNRY
jgi:hypothetical protein